MNPNLNAWEQVNLIAQIADLKETDARNTLALSALIEILVEKGILTPEDFHRKAARLEHEAAAELHGLDYASSTESQAVDRS